jgi:molecular chaperone DnaK
MASDNITLGHFQLSGIPPAPRGIPQIEVTFDIDANGIVNVSAKDLGTGKEQHITITSSTKLSEDEINQKIKEAQQYAEADKAKKEQIDVKNQGETLIYETEKNMKDLGDKLSEDEKAKITAAKDALQSAINAGTTEDIKAKIEALTNEYHIISTKLYEQAAQQNAQNQGAQGGPQGGFDPNMGQGFNPNMGGFGGQGFNPGAGFGGQQGGAQSGPQNANDNVVDADFEVVDDDKK